MLSVDPEPRFRGLVAVCLKVEFTYYERGANKNLFQREVCNVTQKSDVMFSFY